MGELLSPHLAAQLAAWGIKVSPKPGRIASRQKCKLCGVTRYELRDGWLWCAGCGRFPATAFEIVLKHDGSTLRLGYDQQGRRLGSYPDAEAALIQIRRELEAGSFEPRHWSSPQHNSLLWDHYVAAHFERERQGMILITWRAVRPVIPHITRAFLGRNLRDIKQGMVNDWALTLTGFAPSYQAYICKHMARLFRDAEERQDIVRALNVPRPKIPRGDIEWLKPSAQELVLAAMPSYHRPIFRFLMLYGCRPGEAAALKWDCIDRREEVVTIRRTISCDRVEDRTKTGRARLLPLGEQMQAILTLVPPGLPHAFVFRNRDAANPDGRYSVSVLGRIWRKAVGVAGLPPIQLKNGTRHSAGNRLVQLTEGGTVDDAAVLLGHANTAITSQYYARPELARLRRIMEPGRVVNLLSTKYKRRGIDK